MDEKQLATAAFQFLQRTQVQGSEVPAFVQVMQWLQGQMQAPGADVRPPSVEVSDPPAAPPAPKKRNGRARANR